MSETEHSWRVRPDERDPLQPLMALTVIQPWASAIAMGLKTIETRSWGTRHRGPLVIHAAATDRGEVAFDKGYLFEAYPAFDAYLQDALPAVRPRGAIIAIGRLVACTPAERAPSSTEEKLGHFGRGRWGWQIEAVWPLPQPIHTKGRLGLWEVTQPALGDLVRQWRAADGS